ncbi:AAA family ATPase [Actinomadura kijaniata]|uniref:AAA family ATPase n=1 Tax=Actinomadura kijaniata TaxID=46161 RepID=UPI003F1E2455
MTPPAERSALHDETGGTGSAPERSEEGENTAGASAGAPLPEPRGRHAKGRHAKRETPPKPGDTPPGAGEPPVKAGEPEAGEATPDDAVPGDTKVAGAAGTPAEPADEPGDEPGKGEEEAAAEAPTDTPDEPDAPAEGKGAEPPGLDVAAAVDALAASSEGPAEGPAGGNAAVEPVPDTVPDVPAVEPVPETVPDAVSEPPPGAGAAKMTRGELVAALTSLREQLGAFEFVLDVPGVEEAREARDELRNQLVDYVLPRVQASGKPMLVVLGGSTGAGKSTLVNTLVGARVSATGVLRPTTSSPILVCHPDHVDWFMEGPLLPGMGRVRGPAPDAIAGDQLVVIASEALPPGLALLDSPDFDSVFEDHYEFATKLMAAADLWLCVTTAARYADAQVWQMLRRAKENGATVGVVLSRVPDGAGQEVVEHFGEMLTENGVGDAHRFTVPETRIEDSRLPEEAIADIRSWLVGVAENGDGREVVIGDTLAGVLDSFRTRVPELAKQVEAQVEQRAELARRVESAYATALAELDEATRNGSLLRGEVLARWQDFAGTGDLLRSLHVRRRRGRGSARRHRSPARVRALKAALRGGLESLIMSSAEHAAEQVLTGWREHPAGERVLGGPAPLEGVSPELSRRVTRAVSSWQDHVQELVRTEGVTKRSVAKLVSFDPEALSLVLMVGLLGYGTADVKVEGGTSALPQRLLKALFGAESLRGMGAKARADLRSRIGMLFDEEAIRFGQALDAAGIPDQTVPVSLYQATYNLEVAR